METFQDAGIMVTHVIGGGTVCKTMVGGILETANVLNKLLDLNNYILRQDAEYSTGYY